MPNAARLGDPIGHSPTMNWLVKGLLVGAAIGAAIAIAGVLIVGTGGLAGAAIIGAAAGAAGGAGVGELMSTMSWAHKEVVGAILGACSSNVFINYKPAARAHVDLVQCSKHPGSPVPIATGSGSVYINGQPAARLGDKTGCGGDITEGSSNVFIGGGTQQTDIVNPENLVPLWVHGALLAVGLASGIAAVGWTPTVIGFVGSIGGGYIGSWKGGEIWGEGSDGQKWAMLGTSVVSSILSIKGGLWVNKNYGASIANLAKVSWANLRNFKPETEPVVNIVKTETIADQTFISEGLEKKILFGKRVINKDGIVTNRIVGAHSGDISNSHPNYIVEELSVNADGTRDVKLFMRFEDGTISKVKDSTLLPAGWSNRQFINAAKETGNTQPVMTTIEGYTLHQSTVNGLKIEVIKSNGEVTSAYPVGRRGFMDPSKFK